MWNFENISRKKYITPGGRPEAAEGGEVGCGALGKVREGGEVKGVMMWAAEGRGGERSPCYHLLS